MLIGQLMSNLIENAFQHAGDALDIKVSVECRPNDVVLYVQDNGVGIAEDEHEEIFNKFYRIDKSRTKSGSGLGLASAKAIIELHDGTIHVENCKPGLKFCVTFPRNVTQG